MTELSCKLCENRRLDLKKGLICSLTNEKANFINTCNELVLDKTELKKFRFGSITTRLDFEKYEYKFPNQIKYQSTENLIFYYSFFSYWQLYGFFSFPISIILNILLEFKHALLIGLLIISFFHLLISLAFLKQTVGKDRSPFISLTQNNIEIHVKNQKIDWIDIARLYYKFDSSKYEEGSDINIFFQKKWTMIIEKFDNSIIECDVFKSSNRKIKDYIDSYYLKYIQS